MGCSCGRGSEKEIKVLFCPKCKSRDVKYVFGLGNLFGIVPRMKCGGCGLEMVSFPVLVTSGKKLEESNKDKKSIKKNIRRKRK